MTATDAPWVCRCAAGCGAQVLTTGNVCSGCLLHPRLRRFVPREQRLRLAAKEARGDSRPVPGESFFGSEDMGVPSQLTRCGDLHTRRP